MKQIEESDKISSQGRRDLVELKDAFEKKEDEIMLRVENELKELDSEYNPHISKLQKTIDNWR